MDKYSYSGQDSDQLISLMKERRLFLKEIINNTQKWLKAHSQKQPLCIKQRKGKTVYYITQEDGKQKYLRQKQFKIAIQLAQSTYDTKLLERAQKELQSIETFLRQYPKIPADKLFISMNENRKAIVEPGYLTDEMLIARFFEKKKEVGIFCPEGLTQKTENGEMVRSKSEVLIANYLLHAKVPYIYELPLMLNNRIARPDFTVLNVPKRKILCWEHLGMIDDGEYLENALSKIDLYMNNGFYPGRNLIITAETRKTQLNADIISQCIKAYCL